MPKTSVILIQNIVGLGGESDLVKVAAGYARNYLIPHGLAVPLTAANKRRIEALRQRRADREAHEFNTMSELAKSISKLIAVIAVKTGEDGKMFGTVTAGMVADQLKTQFDISLDKRKIHLEHPIKTLGEHDLELRLHPEVTATLKLRVESTTPEVIPVAPAAKEGEGKEGKEGSRTESRGHRRSREEAVAPEGAEKAHRPERKPRTDRPDRPPRSPRPEKAATPAKAEKPEKAEKSE
jgi:large subunit ribosomal protein L9